jgi:protein O-GlcNAc transferase
VGSTDIQLLAVQAHQHGNLEEAERLYRQLLLQAPRGDIAANLGAVLRQRGQLSAARKHYDWALKQCSWHPTLVLNAVNCLQELGELTTCIDLLQQGLQRRPGDGAFLLALARCQLAAGEAAKALPVLQHLVRSPQPPDGCWQVLGVCLCQLQSLPAAVDAFEQALRSDPHDSLSAAHLTIALKDLGRHGDARSVLARMPASQRQAPAILAADAALLLAEGKIEAAAELYEQLCTREPQRGDHWLNLACCQRQLKQVVAPWQAIQHGLRQNPGHRPLQLALLQMVADRGDADRAPALLRNWLGQQPLSDSEHRSVQFLAAGYRLLPAEQLQTLAQRWEQQKQQQGLGPLWPDRIHDTSTQRRLRIGYLSADFCRHPVGRFMAPLLEQHDRSRVCVVGLQAGNRRDALTARLHRSCDEWIELGSSTDLQAARVIADLRLDALIELGGFTGESRIGVLVHRPAPLQLSYLGYFAPTYLRCIDGWIGDNQLFSQLDAADQAGELLQLSGGYMAFAPDEALPEPCATPGRGFRFGCFNNSRKLTAATLELFAAVLAATPGSVLALKSISFVEAAERARVQARFERWGVGEERLLLLPWAAEAETHLASYNAIDVALDPVPYGGATTSCEALWMGVPVVCLAGRGMVGQLTASVLAHSGNSGWITPTSADYVQLAASLARQGVRAVTQRLQLRHQVQASPLGDPGRLARELEHNLQTLISQRRGAPAAPSH